MIYPMIKSSFGLTETGAVRSDNQDSFLLDRESGVFAVADGLGGLPNGGRASRIVLKILQRKLTEMTYSPLSDIITEVNLESRKIGYELDRSGFGTTLTMGRIVDDGRSIEIAHVGDSAAYLVHDGSARLLTVEHTVAAKMAADTWEDASEAIPLAAHHTLTQCMGQDLYIDPQIEVFSIPPASRFFLLTDGVTKPISPAVLESFLLQNGSLEKLAQSLSFRIEAAGAPDNYTILAIEFS